MLSHRNWEMAQWSNWGWSSIVAAFTLLLISTADAETVQSMRGHVPAASLRAEPLRRMAADHRMKLAIALPLRNQEQLTNLLEQLYDPASPQFGKYLSPKQFTESFGPRQEDYLATVNYLQANGFKISDTHPNRTLIEVEGSVAQVEKAFGVKMHWYQHPKENRTYFAPDSEPSVQMDVPLLRISGLDNYSIPRTRHVKPAITNEITATPHAGSGTGGAYTGSDFRNAYLPGVKLTGAGQTVGLFQLSGYYSSDIAAYTNQTGLPGVPIQNVLIGGFNGAPDPTGNSEVALDIEVSISMAPGLSRVIVYEGSPNGSAATVDAILNRMATDNAAKQLSCSWGFDIDAATEQIFMQFAAQGQSFFLASGDNGAFVGAVEQPSDNPYITVVGGTVLTTSTSHAWVSEAAWNGSGGGISTAFSIPSWQAGVASSANFGSATMRNVPDVSMIAHNVQIIADNGSTYPVDGTSIASPLWAGLMALANQRAATLGKPPVGFLNPRLYAMGKNPSLAQYYHDITTGNNKSSSSPSLYPAAAGYDLCTGWGTPAGTNFIEALLGAAPEPLVITSPLGFAATGPAGGPFSVFTQTYKLTNTGSTALSWSIVNTTAWLNVSSTSGSLAPGSAAAGVTISLDPSAASLMVGEYSGAIAFVDTTSGVTQIREFTLQAGNAGFETGDFTNWTFSGQTDVNFPISIDYSQLTGQTMVPGAEDSDFVHSGLYGAFLGQNTSLGFLSQQPRTAAGQKYILSFWLSNPVAGNPNEFRVSWNGNVLYDGVNLGAFPMTNLQFVVAGAGSTAALQFAFRNDQNAFGLDDVALQPLTAPEFQYAHVSSGQISFAWSTITGVTYQVQYTSSLGSGPWNNLGTPMEATGTVLSASDSAQQGPRFYRVIIP